ncbi:hypothetical protein SK128_020020 [Halocaridina rubra]|uniref:SHSP domain-containing protein n=1 Tax=Halocaridina rubra TaxID=373956 RepID=A0AAN9A021_HALRR
MKMTPVKSGSAYYLQKSTGRMMPNICLCGSSFTNDFDWWLPVSRRGHFFQDSFFENTRRHFDSAVKDTLTRWGEMGKFSDTWNCSSASLFDNLSRYRQLRSSNQLKESLATTYVSDNNTHKIVMDIHDFKDGDIKIRVMGEKEVFVEGSRNGLSSSQTFSRRFVFPESVDTGAVTSVLSTDGVLTIEAPVMKNKDSKMITSGNTSLKAAEVSENKQMHAEKKSVKANEINKVFYCKGCNKKIGPRMKESETSVSKPGEMIIPIQIDAEMTKDHLSSTSTQSTLEKAHTPYVKNIKIEKEEDHSEENAMMSKGMPSDGNKVTANLENKIQPSTLSTSYDVPISMGFNRFPIIRRGLFFRDSIFEDMRNHFESAVQEVLSKWGDHSSILDNMTHYRNLRSLDLREENQAAKVIDTETSHKVVLDVHDFINGGDITIKAIHDRELIIEGKIQNQSQGSTSQKKFLKRFVFPRDIQLDAVTSIMSTDGVLTVTAPIKSPTLQLREHVIPMSIEEIGDKAKENPIAIQTVSKVLGETAKKTSSEIHQESSVPLKKVEPPRESWITVHPTITQAEAFPASLGKHEATTSMEHIIPVSIEGECSKKATDVAVRELDIKRGYQEKEATTYNLKQKASDESQKAEEVISNVELNEACTTHEHADKLQVSLDEAKATEAKDISLQKGRTSVSMSSCKYLPITRRGLFFSDTFFQDYQRDFQDAVHEVLVKCRENLNESEIMDTYRNLRLRQLRVENQALKVHEDQHSFWVVLDVKDFIEGDITVYVDDEELVIEGRAERAEAKSTDTLTFSHRFLLPEVTDFNAITSAISSDGVLMVNSPKSGNATEGSVRKTSSVAESKHESHGDGKHIWQTKRVQESSQQSFTSSSHS